MSESMPLTEPFLDFFANGNVDGAASMMSSHSELFHHHGYAAHPLFQAFVARNDGHCYKAPHMRIAEMLTPKDVLVFRDSVLNDDLPSVREQIHVANRLVAAEFPAGRGVSQAIHHWKSIDMGELLITAGADVDVLTSRGESPLGMQLRFGTIAGAQYLLASGADPNRGSGAHMPSRSLTPMIELLLSYGWDINQGQMIHDANHGHGARVITWLKYGADPNMTNHLGETALHLFARRGTGKEAIGALIKAGADPMARDHEGHTPLDLARAATQKTAARALADHDIN